MNTRELIKNYKSQYTPMEEDAELLVLYKNYRETGVLDESNTSRILIADPFFNLPVSTMEKFFQEKRSRAYIQLYTEFLKKWDENESHFSDFSKATVFEKSKEVINNLLTLDPEYITFELTEDCSVFFQSSVNDKNIYLELFFTKEVKEGVETVTNIYQEGKSIFAYGGSIEDTFSKISSKVSQHRWYIEPTARFYGISESSFTETTV